MFDARSTQLCATCAALPIEAALKQLHMTLQSDPEPIQEMSLNGLPWYTDLAAVDSSSVFCSFCRLVMQGLREARLQLLEDMTVDWEQEPGGRPDDMDEDITTLSRYSKLELEMVAQDLEEFERQNFRNLGAGGGETSRLLAKLKVICGGAGSGYEADPYPDIYAEVRMFHKEDRALAQVEIGCPLEPNPVSTKVFDQIRFWLTNCFSNHQRCNTLRRTDKFLPNRVLDCGRSDSDLVYLHELGENSSEVASYTALSHCWGDYQPFTTTKETMDIRKRGIRIKDLPRTFRDAILVTKEVGLQYIWIDSLCIIQDDLQDWQRESAGMAMIYRNASLVIGASNATGDREGFLHRRVTEYIPLEQNKFDVKLLPPKPQRLSATSDPTMEEPLSSRAWCLQERYLPRCMLSFGEKQIYWECAELAASEEGDCIPRASDRLGQVLSTAAINVSIASIGGRPGRRPEGQTYDTNYYGWHEAVKEYTGRKITKSSDRLPALSGLARALSEVTEDTYLAGIWQKGLIEGLLWCKADGEGTLANTVSYRAPSWSWASLNGLINFPVYNFHKRTKWKISISSFEFLASYIDSFLEPSGSDRFGGLKGGWIKLQGPLFPVESVRSLQGQSYSAVGQMKIPLRSSACDKLFEITIFHNGKSEVNNPEWDDETKNTALPNGRRDTVYLHGGFDTLESYDAKRNLFVFLLARLPDLVNSISVYMENRFGMIIQEVNVGLYKRVGIIDSVVYTQYINKRGIISSSCKSGTTSADNLGSERKSSRTATIKFSSVKTQSSGDKPGFTELLSSRKGFTLHHRLWRRPKGITGKDHPDLHGPDPFEGLEQTVVTIV